MSEKLVLIDGHSILNRAFYGVPELTNSEGLHTNAVYGFLNIIFKILDEEKPDYFAVAFDLKAPTFRHKMYDAYKGTRKPMQPELREQVPVIKEVLTAMQVPLMMLEGYEADDLLGTVAKKAEKDGLIVSVVSGDRDLLQLATDRIMIRIPKTKGGRTEIEDYHTKEVVERYQVTPQQIIELKALMGDSSDNIPGIPGVGEKTATKIVVEYGSIENAYEHVEQIKPNRARESLREHYELAQLSKTLATINIESPFTLDMEQARLTDLYTPEAFQLFKRLEFKNLLSRFTQDMGGNRMEESFRTITEFAEADACFAKVKKAESFGFAVLAQEERMYGLALCWGQEQICFLPVQGFLTAGYLQEKLAELIADGANVSTLDLKEHLDWVKISAQDREKVRDAVIGAYLLNPLKGSYPCEDIAKDYAGQMIPGRQELIGKLALSKAFAEEESEKKAIQYGCYLAYTAYAAMPVILEKLQEQGMKKLYEEIEMPLVYTLYDMQRVGIRVASDELAEYGRELGERIAALEQEIYQEAQEVFNINSPKQLGVILFEKLGLPGGKKTKSGYSTAADVLDRLAPDYPIVSKILDYRQVTKLKSTYADGLAGFIAGDGRIHGIFHQTITATGRISSAEPNLQNIPIRTKLGRLLRKVFIPAQGEVFIDADYSQIELRVLAAMAGDEALIEAYRKGQDIHRMTASQVFHIPFDEVTELQRRNAKAVNFGIVYGISAFGLSQDLNISRKEATEYIERYFQTYPKVKEFLDRAVETAKEQGYVDTLFGRRRPVPELKSGNFMQRSFGERVAMNSPIQGTAADIIKIAMIRVNERLKKEGLRAQLILQVHDELLVEAPKEEATQVEHILREEMIGAVDLAVKMEIDLNIGSNWYEAH
ncbi:MAG: DNA polymerase I [Eubacteriales bacterium]|nr:DNA polymerase I [Eubacteriales bacterium]